jgi:hypothetical protein
MSRSKGMQLGAMLAAMLILSMAFVAVVSAQGANEQTKVEKPEKIISVDGRYIMNESDLDKAVIESGTVKIPKTSSIAERINATKNAMDQLSVKIKDPYNEALDTSCDYAAEECTYRIVKLVKASTDNAVPASFSGWTEWTNYSNSGGGSTTLFEGIWNVPSAPLNQGNPLQTIFYFTALGNGVDILQPLLEWGQYANSWDISMQYNVGNGQYFGSHQSVNVGDSIYGYIQLQTGSPTRWLIYIYDITTGAPAQSTYAYTSHTFNWNYVALETYKINNCSQLSGGNDFTNLHLAGRTPSWIGGVNQTAKAICGTLGVNIKSPSEVILQTGRMP